MRDFLDGLDNDDLGATEQLAKRDLHVVNGGTSLVNCIKCNGSGMTRWGSCFRCQGKGKITTRSAAASKAKVTKEENLRAAYAEWTKTPVGLWCLKNQDWNEFARKMIDSAMQWGRLTDGQTAAIERSMAKQAERRAEKAAAPKQEVDVSQIEAMFQAARESGLKRLAFRAKDIEIKAAKDTGRNPGALYVTAQGEYQGKVVDGKFHPVYACTDTTKRRLNEVAANPAGEAKLYGIETGSCSCCGRELTDPESIAMGIGPICVSKWGL